jgi:hypothetical protein
VLSVADAKRSSDRSVCQYPRLVDGHPDGLRRRRVPPRNRGATLPAPRNPPPRDGRAQGGRQGLVGEQRQQRPAPGRQPGQWLRHAHRTDDAGPGLRCGSRRLGRAVALEPSRNTRPSSPCTSSSCPWGSLRLSRTRIRSRQGRGERGITPNEHAPVHAGRERDLALSILLAVATPPELIEATTHRSSTRRAPATAAFLLRRVHLARERATCDRSKLAWLVERRPRGARRSRRLDHSVRSSSPSCRSSCSSSARGSRRR